MKASNICPVRVIGEDILVLSHGLNDTSKKNNVLRLPNALRRYANALRLANALRRVAA